MEGGSGNSTLRGILLFALAWLVTAIAWRLSYPAIPLDDALYKSFQLFGLEFDPPDLPGEPHLMLRVMRLVAPALAVAALLAAISSRFAALIRAAKNRMTARETALVVGFGATGRAAARALRRSRPQARVIALDRRSDDGATAAAKGDGIELFLADALDAAVTERFPIELSRADTLVVACGDDAASMAVAEELAARRRRRHPRPGIIGADIWMHIRSRRLLEQLREADFARQAGEARLVHPFGLDEAVMQDLLLRHPPALRARQFGHKRVHAVLHGFDEFAWTAAEQILLNGQLPGPGFTTPLISVVTADPGAAEAQWRARHGDLADELEVGFHHRSPGELGWIGNPEPLATIERLAPPNLHIFSLDDDRSCISAALALREAMQRGLRYPAPIAVRASLRGSAAIAPERQGPVLQQALYVVGDLDEAACFTVFGNRILESFARQVHEDYLKLQGGMPFDELPETLQVANRRAAYHFVHKLKLLGFEEAAPCDAAMGIGPEGRQWLQELPEAERVQLDILEHLRWRADRLLEGWRQGERDDERRLRDQLRLGWTHFDSLSQLEKRKDRSQLEAFLAITEGSAPAAKLPRIEEISWEGPLPRWIREDEQLHLRFAEQPDWPQQAPAGAILRLRILLPVEPRLEASGFADHNRRRAAVKAALGRFAAEQLTRLPPGSRIRFERMAAPGWDWLESMDLVDGVVLPPPVVGFTGPADPACLGDPALLEEALLDHLRLILPAGGATLVTGAAAGAEEIAIRLWKRHGLGPVHAIFPSGDAEAPRTDDTKSAFLSPELRGLIDDLAFPQPQLREDAHQAVARAVLDRATHLLAVCHGRSHGAGEMLAQARARRMSIRLMDAPGLGQTGAPHVPDMAAAS